MRSTGKERNLFDLLLYQIIKDLSEQSTIISSEKLLLNINKIS